MPPKRKANGAAPGQRAAQRLRLATAAPDAGPPLLPSPMLPLPSPMPPLPTPVNRSLVGLPLEIQTLVIVESLVVPFPNRCAFARFCQDWDICSQQQSKPQLDEILRILRVDVYTPSPQALRVQAGQGHGGVGEQSLGEIESYFAGHSKRKALCSHFQDGTHGFDNKDCEECGCVPFEKTVMHEDIAAWDWEWEGKLERGVEGGPWTGRLRNGMGYRGNGRDGKRSPPEWWDSLCKAAEIKGEHAFLNSIRHTSHGRFLCREVKRERAMRPDRLVVLKQRPAKWLGRFTQRCLKRRLMSGLEGLVSWGDEMVGLLPFVEGFTERFDDSGYLRVHSGQGPSSPISAAIKAGPFDSVKKNLAPESPGHERRFLYRDIRHLMINFNTRCDPWQGVDDDGFGILPRTDPPTGTARESTIALKHRLAFENMVPLYVDYQALTNLETLDLDLRNVPKEVINESRWQTQEVIGLAQRLRGKNLRLLVIAGLRTGPDWWPHEKELTAEDLVQEAVHPTEWDEVNWFVQFRGALRPGGKLLLVDANTEDLGRRQSARHHEWINEMYDQEVEFPRISNDAFYNSAAELHADSEDEEEEGAAERGLAALGRRGRRSGRRDRERGVWLKNMYDAGKNNDTVVFLILF
ncbi:hypothetical protein B0T09DRAFT_366959 [Sordaria sp. MPI-SDFR-AT-0083]|nr:hypothetical protein B0T09DRAFT_366959 [Sordaria sp. MPI-SDFR-AT-0083]